MNDFIYYLSFTCREESCGELVHWHPGILGRYDAVMDYIHSTGIPVKWQGVIYRFGQPFKVIWYVFLEELNVDNIINSDMIFIGFRTNDPELVTMVKLKFGL